MRVQGNKLAGVAIHTGARIAGLAGPGDVLVSRTVKELVAGSEIRFQHHGEHRLEGLSDSVQVFQVRSWASTDRRAVQRRPVRLSVSHSCLDVG